MIHLGDMLTRIRNAQMRYKVKVTTPASKLRERVLDVLAEEGYIRGYARVDYDGGTLGVRDRAQIFRRRAGDQGHQAGVDAGPAGVFLGAATCRRSPMASASPYCRRRKASCRIRARGPRMSAAKFSAASSRRKAKRTKVDTMSRIGKKPVAIPGGVTAAVNGQEVKVKGPKGELKHVLVDDIIAKLDKDEIEVDPAGGHQGGARHVGHVADADRQPRRRRDRRLHQEARDHGRGLSRRGARRAICSCSLATATTSPIPSRRASRCSVRSRPRSSSPASTSRRWDRSRPRSGASGRPSPIRARASDMRASSSSAKKARRSSGT